MSVERGQSEDATKAATAKATPGGQSKGRLWVVAAIAGTVVVPSLLWAAILAVPFLPLTTGEKVWVSGGLAVAAEAVFWISALLVGGEVARRYRRVLDPRPWVRKLLGK